MIPHKFALMLVVCVAFVPRLAQAEAAPAEESPSMALQFVVLPDPQFAAANYFGNTLVAGEPTTGGAAPESAPTESAEPEASPESDPGQIMIAALVLAGFIASYRMVA